MKHLFYLLLLLGISTSLLSQKSKTKPSTLFDNNCERAKEIVLNYLEKVNHHDDIDSILKLCTVPFEWNKNLTLTSIEKLKVEQKKILDENKPTIDYKVDSLLCYDLKSNDLFVIGKVIKLTMKIKRVRASEGTSRFQLLRLSFKLAEINGQYKIFSACEE